jgi:hypothetical protein
VADFLLEFHPDIVNVRPSIIDEYWVEISEWRLFVSAWLAAFWLPFYMGGYWLIYQGLKKAFPTWAKVFFFSGVYGVIMGSPIAHTVLTLNPIKRGWHTAGALPLLLSRTRAKSGLKNSWLMKIKI